MGRLANPIVVAGAAGHIGRAIVARAAREGWPVVAVLRPGGTVPSDWAGHANIRVVELDLQDVSAAERLAPALTGARALVNAAGTISGRGATPHQQGLAITGTLINAMTLATDPPQKFLHFSSILVGDLAELPVGSIVTEDIPRDPIPSERDNYTATKIEQEELIEARAAEISAEISLLRTGFVTGEGRVASGHLGLSRKGWLLGYGTDGEVPLITDQDCARIVLHMTAAETVPPIVNLIADRLPGRSEMATSLQAGGHVRRVVMNRPLARLVAGMTGRLHRRDIAVLSTPMRFASSLPPALRSGDPLAVHKCRPEAGLRIGYLTGEYPRATDTFIQREVAGLRHLGMDVSTCSVRRTSPDHLVGPEQRQEAGNTFYVLEAARNPLRLAMANLEAVFLRPGAYGRALRLALTTGAPGIRNLSYQLFYFAEAVVLARYLERRGVTHLHNHIAKSSCSVAMIASELSGIPFSFTLHGPDIFFAPEQWRLDAKIARARFVACISHYCRSQAMAHSDQVHWNKLHIVHCGVEPERYTAPKIAHIPINALFVGRLSGVKGVPVLLEAMTRMQASDLHLTLIGDGPDRPALEQQVREFGLGKRVTFAGYKSQSEVAEGLRRSDMLILPSFAEGLPVVLMEALAAECPVIATRIAGVAELVEDGRSGLIVSPGDANALAEAMDLLAEDPAKRARMGAAGRRMVEAEFTITTEVARLARLIATGQGAIRPAPIGPAIRSEPARGRVAE